MDYSKLNNSKFITLYIFVFFILYIFCSIISFIGKLPILILVTFFISYYIYNEFYQKAE